MPKQSEVNNHTSKMNVFLLSGHKVDFIAPCGANKSIFWPHSRKKIVCNTGKTFILLVRLLASLYSGIKLHTRKTNFCFPCCTIYYFLLAGYKVDFIAACGANKSIFWLGKKNLFFECEVWCPSKARVSATRVKLMFFY